MNYKKIICLLIINFSIKISAEIFSEVKIINKTDSEVIIKAYSDVKHKIKGTEIKIPKYGEAIIEGVYKFFGCEKYIGWSQNAILIIDVGNQQIGPLEVYKIFKDIESEVYIKKINNKYYLDLENEEIIV